MDPVRVSVLCLFVESYVRRMFWRVVFLSRKTVTPTVKLTVQHDRDKRRRGKEEEIRGSSKWTQSTSEENLNLSWVNDWYSSSKSDIAVDDPQNILLMVRFWFSEFTESLNSSSLSSGFHDVCCSLPYNHCRTPLCVCVLRMMAGGSNEEEQENIKRGWKSSFLIDINSQKFAWEWILNSSSSGEMMSRKGCCWDVDAKRERERERERTVCGLLHMMMMREEFIEVSLSFTVPLRTSPSAINCLWMNWLTDTSDSCHSAFTRNRGRKGCWEWESSDEKTQEARQVPWQVLQLTPFSLCSEFSLDFFIIRRG